MYNTIVSTECQEEILFDKSESGRDRNWKFKKKLADYMAFAYDDIDESKARRIMDCASWLKFKKVGDSMKLHDARFCRVRLCPICQWRRAQKTFAQMLKVYQAAIAEGYEFIFLTLTWQNVPAEKLSKSIDNAMVAWNRFRGYKAIQQATHGYYRGFEVTYNAENNTYHPHLHVIFAIKRNTYYSHYYLSQEKWTNMWQKAMRLDYDPIVNIKKFKFSCDELKGAKGIAETCKYTCKTTDILKDDWDLTVEIVGTLNQALDKRRFIGLGGVIKEIHKRLNLDDMEDGDLTHIEADQELDTADDSVLYFFWNGFNYYRG